MKLDLIFNKASNDFYDKKLYWKDLTLVYRRIDLHKPKWLFFIYPIVRDRSTDPANFINLKKL